MRRGWPGDKVNRGAIPGGWSYSWQKWQSCPNSGRFADSGQGRAGRGAGRGNVGAGQGRVATLRGSIGAWEVSGGPGGGPGAGPGRHGPGRYRAGRCWRGARIWPGTGQCRGWARPSQGSLTLGGGLRLGETVQRRSCHRKAEPRRCGAGRSWPGTRAGAGWAAWCDGPAGHGARLAISRAISQDGRHSRRGHGAPLPRGESDMPDRLPVSRPCRAGGA